MTDRRKTIRDYSPEARLLAAEILDIYVLAAEKGERKMKSALRQQPLQWVFNSMLYWRNVRQGLTWVQAMLDPQRKGKSSGEQRSEDRTRSEGQLGDSEAIGRLGDDQGTVHRQDSGIGHDSLGLEFGQSTGPCEEVSEERLGS